MRKTLILLAFSTVFSTFALAADWSGTLLDASCYDRQNQQLKDMQKASDACAATGQTTAFALNASGKVYKFDTAGNSKATSALKNRADRSEPGKPASKEVMAKVEGTEAADTIKVDTIEVQ
jgi:hypothetical protein